MVGRGVVNGAALYLRMHIYVRGVLTTRSTKWLTFPVYKMGMNYPEREHEPVPYANQIIPDRSLAGAIPSVSYTAVCSDQIPNIWEALMHCSAISLCRIFVTTELESLYDNQTAQTLGGCAGCRRVRKDGFMGRTHTHYCFTALLLLVYTASLFVCVLLSLLLLLILHYVLLRAVLSFY